MAIDLEVKHRLRELEERIRAQGEKISSLQSQVDSMVVSNSTVLEETTKELEAQPKVRLCPHCGEKPGYFFHVRSCAKKKNKNDGDDRNRDPGSN
jgi:uncharacterized coiled-coil protein SlyX